MSRALGERTLSSFGVHQRPTLGPLWAAPFFGKNAAALGGPFFLASSGASAVVMLLFLIKAAISGLLVALISTIARRYPGWGGLVASLPLVSVMAMLWLYGETRDPEKVAGLAMSTFWFILPSLPMFLLIPALLRSGWSLGVTMVTAMVVTMALYAGMSWLAPKLGIAL